MKNFIKSLLRIARFRTFNRTKNQQSLKLVLTDLDKAEANVETTDAIIERLKFFEIAFEVVGDSDLTLADYLNYKLIAFINKPPHRLLRFKYKHVFILNHQTNYDEGWEYHRILTLQNETEILLNRVKVRKVLEKRKDDLRLKFSKAYILGTGPSLEKADTIDWSDGIRIVSNTIVKDASLWRHIQPHFIVAGDAIYHFGISDFAISFRKDLQKRLSETTDTLFVFPEIHYKFLLKEFSDFHDRLIPIPMGSVKTVFNVIETKFELPEMGNVLNLLLLPLACYFSNNVFLWGFDGRSPDAKLFWANSDKQFYTDLVPQLKTLHPAFFEFLVPANNPAQYVNNVHGDVLEMMLKEAEDNGKKFNMMHFSYTKVLMDRYL